MKATAIPIHNLPDDTVGEALDHIAANLREADRREVLATLPGPIPDLVAATVAMSLKSWLAVDENMTPIAVLGVAPSDEPMVGIPWLLTTDAVRNCATSFGRQTARYVAEMHELFPILTNFVDVRNEDAITWLRWAGFEIVDVDPHYGTAGEPFLQFQRIA